MEHSNYYLYIVILSFVATYPVRAIPALFISKLKLSPYWQKVWDLVPYTALTALVFPGIFYCIKENEYAAAIGTVVAVLSAIFKMPLSVTVLLSVAATYIGVLTL
ncbi:MAG: AzlD domain-containing protein [Succinivibrio sp.]|nr:AzlD domain-containing protein [Succinivibrio sp.]